MFFDVFAKKNDFYACNLTYILYICNVFSASLYV